MKIVLSSINKRKYIAGTCFSLSLIFSEPIPILGLGARIRDIPKIATVQFFLRPFPFLRDFSIFLLFIPAVICFLIAVLPILRRGFNCFYFFLLIAGLSFYPLVHIYHGYYSPLLWSILFLSWLGVNLWIRSWDYFYSSSIVAFLWDFGTAIQALWYKIPALGVPYYPNVPVNRIIAIDVFLILLFFVLWFKKKSVSNFLTRKMKLFRNFE